MSANTLLFQEVANKAVITTNTDPRSPGRPYNAGGNQRTHRYAKGRDGQTEGDYLGDHKDHIPICPYHMPRNSNRYNDPRLFMPYKKVGDIIEAHDLNKLFDRINLFLYDWNAEIHDPYGYNLINKLRSPLLMNYSSLIVSDKQTASNPTLQMSKTAKTTTINNGVYFQMYKSTSLSDIATKFNKLDNLTITDLSNTSYLTYPMGSFIPVGLPKVDAGTKPTGKVGVSFSENKNINFTLSNAYSPARPKNTQNKLYNFGRAELMPAELEYSSNGTYKFIIDRNIAGNPIYWKVSEDAGASYQDFTLNETTKSEFVFSYRESTEDPLNPILYYVGLKIFTRPLESNFNSYAKNSSGSVVTVTETDTTFSDVNRFKRGAYPIIKPDHWKFTQLTIKNLLNKIIAVANVAFSGAIDSTTKQEIEAYLSQQEGFADEVNFDNPETYFLNYQAKTGAIIKVGFYNTLIDAYRLMINSCICNSDCSCNVVCTCNINCGCNY